MYIDIYGDTIINKKEFAELPENEKKLYKKEYLSEGFKHGGYEDVCFFYRAHQAGKKLLMTPKVAYWHEEGATRFSEQEKGIQNNAEPHNRAYFKQKHGFDAHEKLNQILTDNKINL